MKISFQEWKKDDFFKDVRADLNLEKVILENCLLYANQGFLSTVKSGEIAMYLHNFDFRSTATTSAYKKARTHNWKLVCNKYLNSYMLKMDLLLKAIENFEQVDEKTFFSSKGRHEMEWSNSKFDSSKFKLTY